MTDDKATDTEDLVVDVTVNTNPAITLPSTPTFDEDSSGNPIDNSIGISDNAGDSQAVAIMVTNGTAMLGTTANLASLSGNGSASTSFAASPLADVNNALDSLTFTPDSNTTGASAASIQVQTDDGNGGTDSQTMNINLTDVDPTISDQIVGNVDEDAANGTSVGIVSTGGDSTGLNFTITGGNTGGAFAIANDGQITVNDTSAVDFENTTIFGLTVEVDDEDSDTTADATATVTVNINDVDENPVFTSATSTSFAENGTGTVIDVNATDGDGGANDANVTYSLTGGGADDSLFSIDAKRRGDVQ